MTCGAPADAGPHTQTMSGLDAALLERAIRERREALDALADMTAKRDIVADEMVAARNREADARALADELADELAAAHSALHCGESCGSMHDFIEKVLTKHREARK